MLTKGNTLAYSSEAPVTTKHSDTVGLLSKAFYNDKLCLFYGRLVRLSLPATFTLVKCSVITLTATFQLF